MTTAYTIETTSEGAFAPAREQAATMERFLGSPTAMVATHDEHVKEEGRQYERRLFQAHLDLRSAAEMRVTRLPRCRGCTRWMRLSISPTSCSPTAFGGSSPRQVDCARYLWPFHLESEHGRTHRSRYAARRVPTALPRSKPALRRVK